jgi:cysteine synthase A
MAAYRLAMQNQGSGKTIITMLCDHGERYRSKILSEAWLTEKGLEAKPLKL